MQVVTRFIRVVSITIWIITAFGTAQLGARSKYGAGANETSRSLLAQTGSQHYEYVFPDGYIYVYDTDNNFQLVKIINVPTSRRDPRSSSKRCHRDALYQLCPDGCCNGHC